ncbi:rhodanese-like domain-containing protein [Micromonosporaceae bacterium Da 78-11]
MILDVRAPHEYRDGHIDGAVNIALPDLPARLADVPPGLVWVHCAAGYRAATAACLLSRAGRPVVHVDDAWANARAVGLPIAD